MKGTGYAFYYLLVGLTSLFANSIFGYLWTAMSSSIAFEYSVATSTAGAAALLLFIGVRTNRPRA